MLVRSGLTVDDGPRGAWVCQAQAWLRARLRALEKRTIAFIPGSKVAFDYQHHRFAPIGVDEVNAEIRRLAGQLRRFERLAAERIAPDIFLIRPH